MKKQLVKNTILSLAIFTLVFSQILSPVRVSAANIEWDNPSKSGNPYKIQLTDTLNGKLLTDVVSCTGLVDAGVKAVTSFASDLLRKAVINKLKKAKVKTCELAKKGAISAVAGAVGLSLTDVIKEVNCVADGTTAFTNVNDPSSQEKQQSVLNQQQIADKRKECLNGIAITLAKNQLAAMTKYTMNWVNSGFEGDPLYVRNIDSFMGNMTDDIMMKELNMFKGQPQYYPYGNSYYRSTILGNITNGDFKESMKQNLSNYLGSGGLGTDAANLVSDSTNVTDRYTNNFASGGWSGWLAFTQYPQNNYLGYTLKTTEYIANKQNTQVENTKAEIQQGNGFMSQKKCVQFGLTQNAAQKNSEKDQAQASLANKLSIRNSLQTAMYNACKDLSAALVAPKIGTAATTTQVTKSPECAAANAKFQIADNDYGEDFAAYAAKYEKTDGAVQGQDSKDCTKWETVTPGSVIASKINTYLNSEVTQLELVNGVNNFLSGIFDSLITTLRNEGLSSISSIDTSGGGSGYNSSSFVDPASGDSYTSSDYTNDSVDLTKDLGNTYVHDALSNKGFWDAKTNTPKIYPGVGETNSYYTVSEAGKTEIIKDGNNAWSLGDRAFFDGTVWQNWKKGEANPIKKRGTLQLQQDYLIAAREVLTILPGVMPKIGELDYCIPGPNPGWEVNTSDTADAFMAYVDGLDTDYTPAGGFLGTRDYTEIKSPDQNSEIVNTYKKMFAGKANPDFNISDIWSKVISTYPYSSVGFVDRLRESGLGWKGSYRSDGTKFSRSEEAIGIVTDLKNKILNDLTLFQAKYSAEINKVYGPSSLMQREFLENESTNELTKNPAYLEMAAPGLNITKNINSYDETITEATNTYSDDIVTANTNIKKLDLIKNRVSQIIVDAQARRNANRDKIIKDYNTANNTNITITEYNKCSKEEDVSFYEDTAVLKGETSSVERCNDGVDNDLDGLVDANDPDCMYVRETPYTQTTAKCLDSVANNYGKDGACDYSLAICADSSASNFLKVGACEHNTTVSTNKTCKLGSVNIGTNTGNLTLTTDCSTSTTEASCVKSYQNDRRSINNYLCSWN